MNDNTTDDIGDNTKTFCNINTFDNQVEEIEFKKSTSKTASYASPASTQRSLKKSLRIATKGGPLGAPGCQKKE